MKGRRGSGLTAAVDRALLERRGRDSGASAGHVVHWLFSQLRRRPSLSARPPRSNAMAARSLSLGQV